MSVMPQSSRQIALGIGVGLLGLSMLGRAHAQEELTPQEMRFLRNPMSEVSLCTTERSAAFQCGSYALQYRARDQISSPDPKERDAAAQALALIYLAKAVVLDNSVSCSHTDCSQKSKFRCEREDALMLSLMQNGMSRALASAKMWQEYPGAFDLGLKVEQALPSDYGFSGRYRSDKMLIEYFTAKLRPLAEKPRRVDLTVGWGINCQDYYEFASSVRVWER